MTTFRTSIEFRSHFFEFCYYLSVAKAGRSRCHSLCSFSIPRMRSTRLRVPSSFLFVSFLATYEIPYTSSWRTQLQPIRTIGKITVHIKILPARQPYLYQELSKKATQLRLLGMSYGKIARSLNINRKTATKACKYKVKNHCLGRQIPLQDSTVGENELARILGTKRIMISAIILSW